MDSVDPASTDLQIDSFLRIASISLAAYDYLFTLPTELRVYRSITERKFRWSTSVVLFILIRYVSVTVLVISNVGWFYHGFSKEACLRYYMLAPVFKVIQTLISQVIIGYRTWNISQRSREVGVFLLVFGFPIGVLEAYSNFDSRTHVQKSGNCAPGNNIAHVPQWVFYLLSSTFDITTIVLSSFFLIRSAKRISRMSSLVGMLFYDGLGYVVVLTAVNILNMVLYRNSVEHNIQASGASFGYTVVWIMSQRFLIHVHEAAEVRAHPGFIFTTPSSNQRGSRTVTSAPGKANGGMSLDVQVKIEQAVMIDYAPRTHRIPGRTLWDRRKSESVTNGDGLSPDVERQAQWELSSVTKRESTPDGRAKEDSSG